MVTPMVRLSRGSTVYITLKVAGMEMADQEKNCTARRISRLSGLSIFLDKPFFVH